ncbi:uncharacterized protein N7511_000707 [Penicillium nucicola]|uniref:uncharacterized protein n=1 Tax=Penicillium nucicola TaxID=1850975 RepID=UPI0025456309|nr:uncharacterized protein N7511_000707 [Penicillium nucicola]KAJ5775696.1 hypothetical protein N7511_000707 [Penicillium nucicola]
MAHLEARKHISPDSGFPITLHPHFNDKIKNHIPPEPLREPFTPPLDRAFFADPEKQALFSVAKRVDLTESLGTVLENVQLSHLNETQLDELALLVNERGVVFFRDQDLTTEKQVELFQHYDRHPAQKDQKFVNIQGSREDHREILSYTPWASGDFHADTSFEINQWKNTLMSEEIQLGSHNMVFMTPLAMHTKDFSMLDDTILDLWGAGPNRPPIDTHHPAVRTHPVTKLKALNVNPGFVTGFAELKKAESDKVLDFLAYHIHSADDHYVRWKWAVGSVAMWDNRCTLHRVIPGTYKGLRRGIRTTVFGEQPYFDPDSESRVARKLREENDSGNGSNLE